MPKMPDYFVGNTVPITGAASGIGRALGQIFAREGANVVCADSNAADINAADKARTLQHSERQGGGWRSPVTVPI